MTEDEPMSSTIFSEDGGLDYAELEAKALSAPTPYKPLKGPPRMKPLELARRPKGSFSQEEV